MSVTSGSLEACATLCDILGNGEDIGQTAQEASHAGRGAPGLGSIGQHPNQRQECLSRD